MKSPLILFFFFVSILSCRAQNWCPPGSEWHYRVYNPMYPYQNGYLKVSNTGTVIVGGQTCNNLSGVYYGILYTPTSPSQTLTNYAPVQTYEANGVTYFYNTNTSVFDTIANFNASVGDKWRLIKYEPSNTASCNFATPVVTVTDTGRVLINGYNLKRLVVNYSNTTDTIIERISNITHFLFPEYSCVIDDWSYGTFVCYSDNTFPLYKRSGITVPCDYISGISEKTNDHINATVFPNPAEDNVHLLLRESSNTLLELNNSMGEILLTTKIISEKTVIDLSVYSPGIYFLKVANTEGAAVFKIIKH